jgi:predicted house-cleaning noncanonical NTP pyrophosphatase (MazG superfamily)
MGLEEGRHFSVKMPEEGRYGSGRQRKLAAEFVEYILQRAREEGEEVYEKVREIIEEGKARGSLKLEGFEKEV